MCDRSKARRWFCSEVLPLEPVLLAFLRRNWRNHDDILEFRQEVFARMFDAALVQRPANVRAFMLVVARNLLINHVRRAAIVRIDLKADLESFATVEDITPERIATARDELRNVRSAIGTLPPRCQEVVLLRKVEGLSHREISARTGLSIKTIETHLTNGMRRIADRLFDPSPPPSPTELLRRTSDGDIP